jgi:hypothetical protein
MSADPATTAALLAELEGHECDVCTPYERGSGTGSRKCALAASLRILLFREADRHGLDIIPARLRLWVVGPNQRRMNNKRWVYSTGPNGAYWRKRDRQTGDNGAPE